MRWGKKKLEKKGGGVWKFIPPRLQSGGVLRRYPPVLDPEDLGIREKNFRARYARAKKFLRGGMQGITKKKIFGGIVKTKALATHTLYPPTHTSHPEH